MEYVKLSDVCDVRDGTHDSPKYVDSGYPLVTSKNIVDGKLDLSVVSYLSKNDYDKINERSKVDPGDIIMPMIGTIGNPYLVDDFSDFAIKNVALIKFPKKDVINKFVWYFLKSYAFRRYVDKTNKGGTQKFLSLNDIRNVLIPQFCFEKQTDIVNHLDKLFSVLRKRMKELVLLDNLIKARFMELFGNVRNWESIESIAVNGPQNGFYRKADGSTPNTYIVKMKELFANECISDETCFDMVNMTPKEQEKFALTSEDLLFGRRSLVVEGAGKCRRVGEIQFPLAFESSLLRITLNTKKVLPRYVQAWFDTEEGRQAIISIRAVTTISGIKGSDLKKVMIPVPALEQQERFLTFARQIDKSKVAVQKSLEETQLLFDKLMQEYFG